MFLKCVGRTFLWLYWLGLAVVTAAYAALSLASFANIYEAYDDNDSRNDSQLRALLAATFFGFALVLGFIVVTFLIMVGKTVRRTGAGFGYGLMLASSFHMFITALLCALVLHGFEDQVEDWLEDTDEIEWQGEETDVYQATWSMAYISAGLYLIFTICLFIAPAAFRQDEEEKAGHA